MKRMDGWFSLFTIRPAPKYPRRARISVGRPAPLAPMCVRLWISFVNFAHIDFQLIDVSHITNYRKKIIDCQYGQQVHIINSVILNFTLTPNIFLHYLTLSRQEKHLDKRDLKILRGTWITSFSESIKILNHQDVNRFCSAASRD